MTKYTEMLMVRWARRCAERLVIYCQTTSVSAAHATHCATYCTPFRPLIRAFSGWIRTPPPTQMCKRHGEEVGEPSFFFFITLEPRVEYTEVYEPSIRALFGTASHLCEVVALKLGPADVQEAWGRGMRGFFLLLYYSRA